MGEKEITIHVELPFTVPPESVINLMAPPHIKPITYDHKHALNNGGSGGSGRGRGELRLDGIVLKKESYTPLLQPPPGFAAGSSPSSLCTDSSKRRRGRPLGSRNRPKVPAIDESLGRTEEEGFTPYLMTVQTGQDVLAALSSFHFGGARTVCVLSATGIVSRVTIRTYEIMSTISEGQFEILSLTGFFVANDPTRVLLGHGLTISVSDINGSVRGGAVCGPIVAASPIQVVLGSFTPKASNELLQERKYTKQIPPTPTAGPSGRPGAGFVSLLQSQMTWAESTTAGAETKSGLSVGPLDEIKRDEAIKAVRNIHNLNLEADHGEGNCSDQTQRQYYSSSNGQTFMSSVHEELFGV